ncbi:MAG: serine/threonine protein kinase [Deltaproteobacteria bacterium]|nr:serine/threonine protein kinase [Deltaproteobacteria bacterium]
MQFGHKIYGLRLCANHRVPGLDYSPVAWPWDAQIFFGFMPPGLKEIENSDAALWYVSDYQDEHGSPSLKIWKESNGGYYRMRYSDGTDFLVDEQGARIWATWSDRSTLEDTTVCLLGPVLGFILSLRRILCLHASAIAVGGRAIAIVGSAGAGKSTTAAAFAQLGYPVLSDDIVALSKEQPLLVQPGYPRVRLWPDVVKALYGSPDALPRLTPTWNKCYLDLAGEGSRFQQKPLPLGAVYILGERSHDPVAPFMSAVPLRSGLIALVANTYANKLLDDAMRAQEFAVLCQLMADVPVRQVTPHIDSSRLSQLCHTILEDFTALITTAMPHNERSAN